MYQKASVTKKTAPNNYDIRRKMRMLSWEKVKKQRGKEKKIPIYNITT